jgi:hypothetical protein
VSCATQGWLLKVALRYVLLGRGSDFLQGETMHVAVRSYLLAGVTVVGASALVVAPVAPKIDAAVPALRSALVHPTSLVEDFIENALILGTGFQQSSNAFTGYALPNGLAAPGQVSGGFQRDTDQIPVIVGDVFRGFDDQLTGVAPVERPEYNITYPDGYQDPGYYQATDGTPAEQAVAVDHSILAGPVAAVDKVAQNLVDEKVPGANTIQAATVQTRKVGVTVVQAQGLVRTSAFEAVQDVYGAAYAPTRSPATIAAALNTGGTRITNSILGNPSAPAGTVNRLGAVKAVADSVTKAANEVGKAVKKDLGGAAAAG